MPTNRKWLRSFTKVWPLGVAAILIACCIPLAQANAADGDFNIQVSPSPLVVNLTPGQTQTATLTVRNFSTHSETLTASLRGVDVDSATEKVSLNDILPAGMERWVHFSPGQLTVEPGKTAQLTVTFNTPGNVGFSYSVAIALTSAHTTKTKTGAAIRPQVDVFTLININRSDAKSKVDFVSLTSDKSRYAFLPANFSLKLKNNGNIISQPSGTVFIQRSFNDTKPIATLPVNKQGGYILPGTTRSFNTSWTTGFPVYVTEQGGKRHLKWDWKHLGDIRMGRYVAKAVLIYDNGQQDVPLITSHTFWVIPWWLILFVLLTVGVLVMGIVTWGRLIFAGTRKVRGYARNHKN
jgi:hypothetical protein